MDQGEAAALRALSGATVSQAIFFCGKSRDCSHCSWLQNSTTSALIRKIPTTAAEAPRSHLLNAEPAALFSGYRSMPLLLPPTNRTWHLTFSHEIQVHFHLPGGRQIGRTEEQRSHGSGGPSSFSSPCPPESTSKPIRSIPLTVEHTLCNTPSCIESFFPLL